MSSEMSVTDRLGLAVGLRNLGALDMADLAQAAESTGLNRFVAMEAWRETVVPLSACAMRTQRIGLGTGVMQIFPVNPVMVALQASALQELTSGRFTLGIGLGAAFVVPRWFGVPYEHPMTRMREFLEIVRGVHASAGATPFSYDGELFTIRKYSLGDAPVRPVPLHIAAVGPRMQELAGELADGVMVGALYSAGHLADVRERLAVGAARAGRDPAEVEISYHLIAACDNDGDRARSLARRSITYCTQYPHYLKRFAAEGFGQLAEQIGQLVRSHENDAAEALVNDAMLQRFAVAGTPAECREQLRPHLAGDALPSLTLFPFRVSEQDVMASHYLLLKELGDLAG
jgi:alkanesulfonate monooxygenase SsuD/methylene tetrahydromethanopterin reductase-like flavin-dependent oxidoreductase (luciferase family)